MRFIKSIKIRITLWYLLVLSVLLVTMSCGIYFTMSGILYTNLDRSLKARTVHLAEFRNIIGILASGTFEEASGESISFFFVENGRIRDISSKGRKIPLNKELVEAGLSGKSFFSFIDEPESGRQRVYITGYIPDQKDIIEYSEPEPADRKRRGPEKPRVFSEIRSTALAVARSYDDIESILEILSGILWAAVPITLVISGAGGIFLSRRVLRPVESIAETADRIGASDLSRRIEVRTDDELGHLAATLNRMIDRLEKAFERQKQFTSDASHELRAPLAIIQAESSLSLQKERTAEDYRRSLEIISSETENMSELATQLLTLARGDSGRAMTRSERICLTEMVKNICVDVEVLFQEKGIGLYFDFDENVYPFVKGDKRSLRRLMLNLLNNALKYTEQGGNVSVSLRQKTDAVEVSVTDNGIGIPEEDLPFIFERFYRVDKARTRGRSGSGLGLAICRQIADMHGGSIEVESSPGKGSAFHFLIPSIN